MKLKQLHEQFITDKDEIVKLLKQYCYNNINARELYIENDGTINSFYNIDMLGAEFPNGRLPFKFGEVSTFRVSQSNLVTLEGSPPTAVIFDCSNTKITSFVGSPKKVDYFIGNANLRVSSILGLPEESQDINISKTGITHLHNIHKIVKRCVDIDLMNCKIESHILGLMLVKDLKFVNPARLFAIINDCLEYGLDIHDAQEKLIEAGLSELAKL